MGAAGAGAGRYLAQVGGAGGKVETPQGVVAAEFNDQDGGTMGREQFTDPIAPAGGSLAADAGVDDLMTKPFAREALAQQLDPAGAAAQAIFGRQAVTEHQDRRAAGRRGLSRVPDDECGYTEERKCKRTEA